MQKYSMLILPDRMTNNSKNISGKIVFGTCMSFFKSVCFFHQSPHLKRRCRRNATTKTCGVAVCNSKENTQGTILLGTKCSTSRSVTQVNRTQLNIHQTRMQLFTDWSQHRAELCSSKVTSPGFFAAVNPIVARLLRSQCHKWWSRTSDS